MGGGVNSNEGGCYPSASSILAGSMMGGQGMNGGGPLSLLGKKKKKRRRHRLKKYFIQKPKKDMKSVNIVYNDVVLMLKFKFKENFLQLK